MSVSWATTTPVDSHCIAVRKKKRHSSHVGSLSWNQQFLSSGGDSMILQHDIGAPTSHVATYTGHTQNIWLVEEMTMSFVFGMPSCLDDIGTVRDQ
jgi:hypothetical protein